jgi:hypothetical protein
MGGPSCTRPILIVYHCRPHSLVPSSRACDAEAQSTPSNLQPSAPWREALGQEPLVSCSSLVTGHSSLSFIFNNILASFREFPACSVTCRTHCLRRGQELLTQRRKARRATSSPLRLGTKLLGRSPWFLAHHLSPVTRHCRLFSTTSWLRSASFCVVVSPSPAPIGSGHPLLAGEGWGIGGPPAQGEAARAKY